VSKREHSSPMPTALLQCAWQAGRLGRLSGWWLGNVLDAQRQRIQMTRQSLRFCELLHDHCNRRPASIRTARTPDLSAAAADKRPVIRPFNTRSVARSAIWNHGISPTPQTNHNAKTTAKETTGSHLLPVDSHTISADVSVCPQNKRKCVRSKTPADGRNK